nr:hypothetical protein [Tanacetum cinerariifolium]
MDTTIDQQVAMDEALIPHAKRLRIGMSNFLLLSDIKSKESTLQLVYDHLRQCPFFKAFLVTADVEHKDTKKSNEMYYPRFMKVIIHHFMSKDPSIPRRNKELHHLSLRLWKTKSSPDVTITPPTVAACPRLTTFEKGKQAAKATKAKSLSALSEVAITEAQHLKLVTKRILQQTRISQASGSGADEGTGSIPGVPDVPTDESEEELSWNSTDEEGDDDDDDQEVVRDDDKDDEKYDEEEGGDDEQEYDEEEYAEETRDEESFDPIPKTLENSDDEGNGEEDLSLNVGRKEDHDEEEEEDELYRGVNINQRRGIQATLEVKGSHVTLTPVNPDVAPLPMTAPTMTPSTIATITITSQAPILPTTAPSTIIQDLPNFGSLFGFDNRLMTLEANFSEFMQTNQFARAVSAILEIVQRYMDQRMNEAVKKIIKEQVKKQVKVQVSKILPRIEQTVNEKLEAEVLTRSSHSLKTSYAVAADLSETELKKILIEKMEGNKSIHRSDLQRNLYKAFVEAYESDKIILDTYGETITLKRWRDDDADKDKEPSTRPDQGLRDAEKEKSLSQQALIRKLLPRALACQYKGLNLDRRAEDQQFVQSSQHPEWFSQQQKPPSLDRDWNKTVPATHGSIQPWISELSKQTDSRSSFNELMDTPLDFSIFLINQLKHPEWFSQQQKPPSLDRDWNKTVPATHGSIQPWISELSKQTDSRSSFNELMDTPLDFSIFLINQLKVDTLTLELLAGPTYELMKGSCKSLVELKYHLEEVLKATTDQLDKVNPKGQQYPHNLLKPLPLIPNNRGRRVIPFEHFINNDLEYLCGGASSRKYTTSITKTKAADYRHIKWIEDLVPRTIWIEEPIGYDKHALWGRRVEDLQLGVESYQKKLNLTKPDTYHSDLKRKETYIAYSNPRGFIYQNKDKKNRLMRIDELHKFSDGTLTDVRTALDDRLKGIWMQYLRQSIWRKSDKDRAAAMIQAIDKRLKTRRIMRSLERFVGRRLYEGDLRMLQRTI